MKINVKQKDCTFYVNEEQRKVVCVIPHTRDLIFDYIEDFPFRWCIINEKLENEMLMPPSFHGVATCHESDTFDVETGKLIAFNKAKNKMHTSFFKRANKLVNYIDGELNAMMYSFNDFGARLSESADKREKAIEERLKNDNS